MAAKVLCRGCGKPVIDLGISAPDGSTWHAGCRQESGGNHLKSSEKEIAELEKTKAHLISEIERRRK